MGDRLDRLAPGDPLEFRRAFGTGSSQGMKETVIVIDALAEALREAESRQ